MSNDAGRVELREITADTVLAVVRLSVDASRQGFVAPNAVSLAPALFAPEALADGSERSWSPGAAPSMPIELDHLSVP